MKPPRWLEDSRAKSLACRWSLYERLPHSHPWTGVLSPGQCRACTEITVKEIRPWG